MIQLLFSLIFAEKALIVIFVFKTPLRKLVIIGLDRVKRGRGPIIVKTVAGTVFVVMMSTIYSVASIHTRWVDEGFALFLAFMIDRLHHYIRELSIRRKTMEAVKKQNRAFEDGKSGASEEIKTLEGEASALRGKIRQLESELVEKAKEASSAEANAGALRKQSEGFLLEYDRLLEENQNLRSQLQSLDRKLSRSESKKVS
ncbi:B-cell receptor-associated protein 31 isoform X2 [Capsicum annuum]|uniref:B-cell receptor-associated protein 31 isoform X2 n=1 Tax=Capsicum annuum TaxID=4072 RepID=UPI001FB05BA9|nr:B-cell receptor-associated protein 31 isoform X2 [Capsicum annuum]